MHWVFRYSYLSALKKWVPLRAVKTFIRKKIVTLSTRLYDTCTRFVKEADHGVVFLTGPHIASVWVTGFSVGHRSYIISTMESLDIQSCTHLFQKPVSMLLVQGFWERFFSRPLNAAQHSPVFRRTLLRIIFMYWTPSSEFVSSSIPSWQISTAHAQPFRGPRDLAFCRKVPLDSLLVWASSEGSGETARMRRLAWTFAARIGDKYQIRLTRPYSY